jgi:putative serine protease PepD
MNSTQRRNSGVGFAIPSNTVKRVVSQIVSGDKVQHSFLGVQLSDGSGGATVAAVTSGSPAAAAGISKGEVITAVDGAAVTGSDEVVAAVQAHSPGDRIALSVRNGSGSTRSVSVTLANRAT